jgi:hypothetical protein
MIDGMSYDLSHGSVFRIRATNVGDPAENADNSQPTTTAGANGQAPAVEVIQLPFAPLEVTPKYVDELNDYFIERGLD